MSIDWKIKDLFLDRYAIARTMDSNTIKFLSKVGAYTRTTMQQSMRYADAASSAGQPPHAHRSLTFNRTYKLKNGTSATRSTSPLKELIFFALEESTKSVWIGPIQFGFKPGVVPPTLEHGGVVKSRKNPRRRRRVLGGGGEIRLGGGSVTSKFVPDVGMVTYAKLKTQGQVDRANKFNKVIYGPDRIGGGTIAPRPFAHPALQKTVQKLPEIWAKAAG